MQEIYFILELVDERTVLTESIKCKCCCRTEGIDSKSQYFPFLITCLQFLINIVYPFPIIHPFFLVQNNSQRIVFRTESGVFQ